MIKIDRHELLRLVEYEGAQVVDVLVASEYDESHIPGAISIPLKEFIPEAVSGLSKSDPVVVYCHDGLWDMSSRAACRLEQLGFERVYDYVGGIADWRAAGLPVEGSGKHGLRVAEATTKGVPTCDVGDKVGEVRDRARAAGWETCVVVAGDGVVVGRLRSPAWDSELDATVGEVMEPGPSTVRPDAALEPLVGRMRKKSTPQVLVTDPQGVLVGVLFFEDADPLVGTDTGQVVDENA